MRMVLVLLLAAAALVPLRSASAQGTQSYTPQTYAPQTWTPQTHSPQGHAPPKWTPQTGEVQSRAAPRMRRLKCFVSNDRDDYCTFFSDREFRPGSPCSCGRSRGNTN